MMHTISDCQSLQCLKQGLHLRFSYFPFTVYITSVKNKDTGQNDMTGVIPEHILPFVFGSLNITYEFVVSEEYSLGAPVLNGTWPGEMGLLQTKVADISIGPQYAQYYNFLDFCPLEFYQRLTLNFLASYSNQEVFDFFTFLYEIEDMVWYIFLLTLVFVMTASSILDSVYEGKIIQVVFMKNLWRTLWIYLASIFCEGSSRTMSSRRGQLLQFLWLFAVLVLVNVLYSQFKSILLVKSRGDYLHSVQELSRKPNILPFVIPNSIIEYVLRDSSLESYKRVYERALSERDKCFIEGSDLTDIEVYQKVKDGTHVALAATSVFKYVLKDICHLLTGSRNLYFIAEDVTYIDMVFYTNWDFPHFLRNAINKRYFIIKEGGFGDLWFEKHFRGFEKCRNSEYADEKALLEMKHLHTAFVLYCYLLIHTIVIFLLEQVYLIFKKKRKSLNK